MAIFRTWNLCILAGLQSALGHGHGGMYFNRVAVFPVCSQHEAQCHTDSETVAEIVTATADGMTLIYGDSANKSIGLVDISTPSSPVASGIVAMGGEVTSVSMSKGNYVLVGINTSPSYTNPSGVLKVVDVISKRVVHTITMGGQPDAVAVSPDKNFAVVAIENERDEDFGNGEIPQLPAGFVMVVDTSSSDPTAWTATKVDLTGLPGLLENSDPEPEYVAINSDNVAVVTLQENNAIVLVDLAAKAVTASFTAGTVDLTHVDIDEEDQIKQSKTLASVPREPDGVTWIDNEFFATADEGDMQGGSRGFTIFKKDGSVVYGSGNFLEHLTASLGHYPEGRSGNKGNEPENVAFGQFGSKKLLFVNSERSSLVLVYNVADPTAPIFLQALPAGVGPEGVITIPSRNLVIAASEKDDRGDKMRSVVNIYEYQNAAAQYPTLVSDSRYDGTPISWAALSGLSSSPTQPDVLYTIEDSAFRSSRVFKIKTDESPARIIQEIRIVDRKGVLAAVAPQGDFDAADLSAMINGDKTVNIDPEGIAATVDGHLWVASEGSGTVGDAGRPIKTLNLLFKIDMDGVIQQVVTLPKAVNDIQLRFGFEGVTVQTHYAVVAFQRAWSDEANPRLGIYDTIAGTWKFVFYPLDAPTSQNGGWVGLSDITSIGNGDFLVLERDNQGGPDASIKKIYKINLGDLGVVTDGTTITKTLLRDLVPDLKAPGGLVYEKMEGMAVMANGDVWVCNDNDGVDDNSGETQLLNLGKLVTPTFGQTCGQVKQAYREQQCCGQPGKIFQRSP